MYVTTKIERHRQSNYSFGLVMCCFRDFLKVKGKILKALSCTDAKIIRLKIDIAVMVIHRLFLRWCGVRQNFLVLRCSDPPQCPPLLGLHINYEFSYGFAQGSMLATTYVMACNDYSKCQPYYFVLKLPILGWIYLLQWVTNSNKIYCVITK